MSESKTTDNIASLNEILQLIKSVEEKTVYNIFIPSHKKECSFKQLNTEQLKRLLKTVVDSPLYNTNFILTLNDIIKETCVEVGIYETLTVLDKIYIFLATRLENISKIYNVQLSNNEIEQYNIESKNYSVDLIEVLNDYKKFETVDLHETFTQNSITLTCSLPTLITENKFENDLHKNIDIDINTSTDLQELIGNTFINEITKFISKLIINDTEINLAKLSFSERIKIIEQLPTPLVNNVIRYIENYKTLVDDILTVKISATSKENTQVTITKQIPYDASFFNN